jgi:hypothetical protein
LDKAFSHWSALLYYKRGDFNIGEESTRQSSRSRKNQPGSEEVVSESAASVGTQQKESDQQAAVSSQHSASAVSPRDPSQVQSAWELRTQTD